MQFPDPVRKLILVLLLPALVARRQALARDKTDVIRLTDGDRITGEIKRLAHGILRVGTNSMGQVRIEWNDALRIEGPFRDLNHHKTFASDPLSGSEATNDYGIVGSIGWSS